ncbi:MAG TPA: cysteine--tRNA ligase, partial [Chthoniobacterales bacterium]|nr:cysteine--tRNA ligase [Chthoniobacterales bacterium]
MPLRFFNTYSRKIEEFAPRADREVTMYTCGPTVYSRAHIGNFRAYIFEDLLQRHLEARGFKVHRVMNLTDVDDKTIRGAREAKIPLQKFTQQFKDAFFEDAAKLRIKSASEYPAATDSLYVERMIAMISALISRGLAYQADDKSVYYRINKFPDYGKLAHLDLAELKPTGRVSHDEYDKEHVGDFALWKAWDEDDGDVKWNSPWGPGRPGWHIECSAMATALLGDQIDIHCGGVDNIFPHHEAEIAQSEGVTGKKFVNYWLHCAHLLVDGQKMAKSLGNFYTVPDVLEKGYTGRELRYALMRVHYRTQLNFTWDGMNEARESLGRIDGWLERLRQCAGDAKSKTESEIGGNFEDALDDDLNISAALGFLFETIRDTNRAMDGDKGVSAQVAASLLR